MLYWIVWNKTIFTFNSVYCLVSRGCRRHWLLLCRRIRPPQQLSEVWHQIDDEVPGMLDHWGMQSSTSLPSHPGLLLPWVVALEAMSTIVQVLFIFIDYYNSGCLAKIRWSVCTSKSLSVPFSWKDSGLCIYHLFVRSNFNFFHHSQRITLPSQSCLVLYFYCANLLHLLIMWLIVSSLSPHNLHLLLVASYLFLLWYDWSLWRCLTLLLVEI